MRPFPDYQLPLKPWRYNPSRWIQRVPIAIAALVPMGIALYMGLYQWGLIPGAWDPVFGNGSTENVLRSDVSHVLYGWLRVPDAILGAYAYFADLLFSLAGCGRRWQFRPWLVTLFGFLVIPVGVVSVILVALQGLVVKSWCFLCLTTAFFSLLMIVLAYDEVCATLTYLWEVHRRSKDWRLTFWTFWGYPSEVAHQVGVEITEKGRKHVGARH
jgi:uncharacterized membrane protein